MAYGLTGPTPLRPNVLHPARRSLLDVLRWDSLLPGSLSRPASDIPFFTDVLRKNGYWVGLDGRHQHLDGSGRPMPHVEKTYVELGMRGKEFESRFDHFVRHADTKGKLLDGVGRKVGAIIDSVPEGKPWFLYFGFQQPHRRWGKDHEGIDPAKLVLPPDWPDLPEVRLDYARYLAELRDLDRGVGLILDELKTRQLEQDTIVIFMGDNGEALYARKRHACNSRHPCACF